MLNPHKHLPSYLSIKEDIQWWVEQWRIWKQSLEAMVICVKHEELFEQVQEKYTTGWGNTDVFLYLLNTQYELKNPRRYTGWSRHCSHKSIQVVT